MVTLKKIEVTETTIKYAYYPEGMEDHGIIQLDRETQTPTLLKEDSYNNSNYRCHAYRRMKEYIGKGKFPENGTVAWY